MTNNDNKTVGKESLSDYNAPIKPKYILITCMDSRITPLHLLGFEKGTVMVIRNAGGDVHFSNHQLFMHGDLMEINPNGDVNFSNSQLFADVALIMEKYPNIETAFVLGHHDCAKVMALKKFIENPEKPTYLTYNDKERAKYLKPDFDYNNVGLFFDEKNEININRKAEIKNTIKNAEELHEMLNIICKNNENKPSAKGIFWDSEDGIIEAIPALKGEIVPFNSLKANIDNEFNFQRNTQKKRVNNFQLTKD